MSQIKFFCQSPLHILKNRTALKSFLRSSALVHKRPIASLNIIFCSDEYLLSINQGHLQHDYYTDIITFDLSPSVSDPIEGELYISVDRVKENAVLHGEAHIKELHRVVFHGLLHLLGFKDKNKADQEIMRIKENEFLDQYLS